MRRLSPCVRRRSSSLRVVRPLRLFALALLGLAPLFATPPPSAAVTIDWVAVGTPGNAADTPSSNCNAASCGSVSSSYYIDKYEVTNAQYTEFLNAKAASDPLDLYLVSMGTDTNNGGITRSGVSGSFTYAAKPGFENKPVVYVTFYDALRFSNWMNNGQGTGSTETGAYTLLGGTATPSNGGTVTRNGGASIFLTNENEWYKAAYFSPGGTYFDYPTGTNSATGCVAPGSDTGNSANCNNVLGVLTNVGAYGLSDSPYGTYDQGGNAMEWTEQPPSSGSRVMRGGQFDGPSNNLAASTWYPSAPTNGVNYLGFRVASTIPEPGTGLLVTIGLVGLALRRRRG